MEGELTFYADAIERRDCASAEERLGFLSPRGDGWHAEGEDREWMFRGQSKAWPLKAKAYRDDEYFFKSLGLPTFADPRSPESRCPVDELRVKRALSTEGERVCPGSKR